MSERTTQESESSLNLRGHCLVAMPGMGDKRFLRSVILICSHSPEGSMGFVLNQPVVGRSLIDIYNELKLSEEAVRAGDSGLEVEICCGGPVEQGRGFVLHSPDYTNESTSSVTEFAGLTSTLSALKCLASSSPPRDSKILLGYSGWSAGQLEREIAENGWLIVPSSRDLIFGTVPDSQYEFALSLLGVSESSLSTSSGHA